MIVRSFVRLFDWACVRLREAVFLCFDVCLIVYMFVCANACLCAELLVCLCVYLFACLFIWLFDCLFA